MFKFNGAIWFQINCMTREAEDDYRKKLSGGENGKRQIPLAHFILPCYFLPSGRVLLRIFC
jgi:hypothetical protein